MIQELFVKISSDFKELNKGFEETQSKLTTLGSGLATIGGTLSKVITLPLLAAGGASIKLASDMEETTNKINVSFGDSAQEVKDWSKNSLKSMGLAQQSALDSAALFGDMGTSMGLAQKDASGMSMALTQLGGDLASFKNVDAKQAMGALAGIFTGETESLKMLGVVMTETNLETFALSQGINENVQDMTEAEKINLRYAYVMNATKNAQGDFGRTSDGAANQMRIFGETMKEIGVQIGTIILPVFTQVVTFVNDLLTSFANLSASTKEKIIIFAGLALALGPVILAFGAVLAVLPSISAGFMTMVSGVKAIGTAMSFLATNPISLILAAVAGLVAAFVYFYNTNENFRGTVDSVLTQIATVATSLWNNVLVPLGEYLKVLWNNIFVPFGKSLSETFSPTIEALSAVLTFLWKQILLPLGTFILTIFVVQFKALYVLMEAFYTKVIMPISAYLIGTFSDNFKTAFETIKTVLEGMKTAYIGLMTFITGVFTGDWKKAWEGIKAIFSGVFSGLYAIAKAPFDNIAKLIATVREKVSEFISLFEKAKSLASEGLTVVTNTIKNVVDKIPFLADGGIITSPTLAMIGEAGSEAVIPLSRLGDFGGTRETSIYLDGRRITQTIAPTMVDMIRGRVGSAY
jgi:phage-related protein